MLQKMKKCYDISRKNGVFMVSIELNQQNNQQCSLCQNNLPTFGSKPIQDGWICRDCQRQLSYWLTDQELAKKNKADILKHIQYRQNNAILLEQFHPDIKVEGKYTLYIDTQNKWLTVAKSAQFLKENPDLIRFDCLREVAFMDEKYPSSNLIDVYFEMVIRHYPFKKIRFKLNPLDRKSVV